MSRKAVLGRRVDEVKVVQIFLSTHFQNQLHGFVNHFFGSSVGLVDFVNHHHRLEPRLKCLAQNKARLRHRAFGRVDQQQGSVCHLKNSFNFAAKVRVTRRIDDVDLDAFVGQRNVLGEDRDATLFFDVARIQDSLARQLRVTKLAALSQQAVNQCSFAMVNVSDDDDVTNVFALSHEKAGLRDEIVGLANRFTQSGTMSHSLV